MSVKPKVSKFSALPPALPLPTSLEDFSFFYFVQKIGKVHTGTGTNNLVSTDCEHTIMLGTLIGPMGD